MLKLNKTTNNILAYGRDIVVIGVFGYQFFQYYTNGTDLSAELLIGAFALMFLPPYAK